MNIGMQTWGSAGDIRPFVALARGLADAGHAVELAVTCLEGKNYGPQTTGGNPSIVDVARIDQNEQRVIDAMLRLQKTKSPFGQLRIILNAFYDPLVDDLYDTARTLSDKNDLLIGHFLLHPLKAAADKAGKPYVSVALNDMGIPSRFRAPLGLPDFGRWGNLCWWGLVRQIINVEFRKRVNDLRKREGLPSIQNVLEDILFSRDLSLVAISPAICRPMPDWVNRHHVCGYFHMDEKDEAWELPPDLRRFLDAGPSPVFITFGSMLLVDPNPADITERLVQAALQAGARAIVQSRWDEISGIPDHRDIYRITDVPHRHIFPRCSAVIHHGGAGTTHAATRHGCPSIVVEHFLDQRSWAEALHRLGVAPKVLHRWNLRPARLAVAISSVLGSREMKQRAEDLARVMQRESGVREAVALIEDHFTQ